MRPEYNDFARRLLVFIQEQASASPPGANSAAGADAAFNALALALFQLQYDHVAPYRRVCILRGLNPGGVRHWTEIPALPSAAFKELDVTSLPEPQRSRVFHSSGTTGSRPGRHFHDETTLRVYAASAWPWFERHLLEDRLPLRILALTPSEQDAPHSSLVHMLGRILDRCADAGSGFVGWVDAAGRWTIDVPELIRRLDASVADGVPLLIGGTAFGFVHLLDALEARGHRVRLAPGSRVMETGGYKNQSRALPRETLHRLIGLWLGVDHTYIVGEYGMSELSSQAYDHVAGQQLADAGRCFRFPPWVRVRVVSPETGRAVGLGEIGLVQVFDLANVGSVLAVQTEDLARSMDDGLELVGRAAAAEPRGCSLMQEWPVANSRWPIADGQ